MREIRKTYLLRLPVKARTDLLPRSTSTLEVTESLCQLKRLDNDALLLLVISDLGVTGEREILAQRVSVETIVRHDSPQIRVTGEEHTEKIVHFSLVPIGAVVEARDGRHWGGLVCVCLDAYAGVVSDGEHVIDHFEALVTGGVVDCGDVGDLRELGGGVVFEEGEGGNHAGWRDVDNQLVFPNRESGRQNLVLYWSYHCNGPSYC